MNTQTPNLTFPRSLQTTASWLDLSKPPTDPAAFSFPLIADNPGMVSQRYLNTKLVPFARNGTRIILLLEYFQAQFSRSILAARSFTALTCSGTVILQRRCFGRNCGLIERDPPTLSWFLAFLDYGAHMIIIFSFLKKNKTFSSQLFDHTTILTSHAQITFLALFDDGDAEVWRKPSLPPLQHCPSFFCQTVFGNDFTVHGILKGLWEQHILALFFFLFENSFGRRNVLLPLVLFVFNQIPKGIFLTD